MNKKEDQLDHWEEIEQELVAVLSQNARDSWEGGGTGVEISRAGLTGAIALRPIFPRVVVFS